MTGAINAAWKSKVLQRTLSTLEPGKNAGSCGLEQLELDWSLSLLLNDHRSRPNPAARYQVSDPNSHQIATAQLAVDRKIEQCAISNAVILVEQEADCPNFLWLERPFRSQFSTHIPCRSFHWIK
jgi:hypothetical protein